MAAIIDGVSKSQAAPGVTREQMEAVRRVHEWFLMDRDAKAHIVEEFDEADKLYRGDHWSLTAPGGGPLRTLEQQRMRPNVVENITFALIEGLVSEFAEDIDLTYFPVEPSDQAVADQFTDLVQFILQKNRFDLARLDWNRNFFKYGTAIWSPVWDPLWRGGRGPNKWLGEIRLRSIHPRHFFPDARCGTDIQNGTRVHLARYVTLEYIRERWPDTGAGVMEDVLDTSLLADVDSEESGTNEAQRQQTLLVETWYIGEPLVLGKGERNRGRSLHVIWWCSESSPTYLAHANYVYYEPDEDPKFPFIVRQRYPRENSIWGYGEAHFIKSPQIVLNKSSELELEGHITATLGRTFYEPHALTPKQEAHIEKYGTLPGGWNQVQNLQGIRHEYGHGVPASLQNAIQRVQRVMETIVGRFDVSQGRTPGSVTAFRALDLLARRAQVRLRTADVAMTSALEEVGAQIANLITKFYTERRAYRILGLDDSGRITVKKRGVFRLEEIQRVYIVNDGRVVPRIGFTPGRDMVEGRDYEYYAPELDVVCRTTTSMPSDRLFYMEVARDLYSAQLIDAETFFYVLQNGKFPPYEQLIAKIRAQQQGQAGAAASPPGPDPNLEAFINGLPPEQLEQLMSLPPDQQVAAVEQLMQQQMGGGATVG